MPSPESNSAKTLSDNASMVVGDDHRPAASGLETNMRVSQTPYVVAARAVIGRPWS
jgi:hypothetical protein